MANLATTNVKSLANSEAIKNKFADILGDDYKFFMQSVVNSTNSNPKLLECDGKSVWSAAMNAAVLGLPIDNNLSYSAIVPFGNKAQFQIMIRGYIQLAIDTGLYKTIHVTEVYEDELDYHNPIEDKTYFTEKSTWKQRTNGEKNKVVGYFAFIELINGFSKQMYMSKGEIELHGKTYSKTFNFKNSVWKDNFDAMGKKTVLKALLRMYGKLGKDTSKLNKALQVDQSFTEDFNVDDPKYYDNPSNPTPEDVTIEVEDDFKEPLGG